VYGLPIPSIRSGHAMFELEDWLKVYRQAVNACFGGRVVFIGLQGSRARGEAREDSDIDVVLILDRVSIDDLALYRAAVSGLPNRGLLCGFVSGKEELGCWSEPDVFQLAMDTLPLQGSLEGILPNIDAETARQAALMGACNLYHACSHNILHKRSVKTLTSLYKSAFFTLQADRCCETGRYFRSREEMARAVDGQDRQVLEAIIHPAAIHEGTLDKYAGLLLAWAGKLILRHGRR